MIRSHGVLAILWLAYFALHSYSAASTVKAKVAKHWPRLFRRYRLLYNASAVLLLVPVLAYMKTIDTVMVWEWSGWRRWIADGLAIGAIGLFVWSTRYYDMKGFMGLASSDAATMPRLALSPLHRHVRHPWYFLALIIIWTRGMDSAFLVSAVLMTGYFWLGSKLEEKKLVGEFGTVYDEYVKRVPGLIPWPGRYLTKEQVDSMVGAQHGAARQSR